MILITGGGSGIGRQLALELSSRNKEILVIGRRRSNLVATCDKGKNISYCVADITTEVGKALVIQHLQNKTLDAIVHNAGTIAPISPINQIKFSAFEYNFKINLFAPFELNLALINKLKGGRVLHVGSGAAYIPFAGWSAYCSSKAALAMLTKCYQAEYNDPVFAYVMPGIVDTPMSETIRATKDAMSKEVLAFHKKLHKDKHLISAKNVAAFLAWLLLDTPKDQYVAREWDIYDKTHHKNWLRDDQKIFPI